MSELTEERVREIVREEIQRGSDERRAGLGEFELNSSYLFSAIRRPAASHEGGAGEDGSPLPPMAQKKSTRELFEEVVEILHESDQRRQSTSAVDRNSEKSSDNDGSRSTVAAPRALKTDASVSHSLETTEAASGLQPERSSARAVAIANNSTLSSDTASTSSRVGAFRHFTGIHFLLWVKARLCRESPSGDKS